MNASPPRPSNTAPSDEDLAAQARPGHGIASQDPSPAAQIAMEPEEARSEAESAMTGGGAVGGAAVGASVGAVVAGPVGVVVGGTLGAVAGALGGAAAGTMANPDHPSVADPGPGDTPPALDGKPANARGVKP